MLSFVERMATWGTGEPYAQASEIVPEASTLYQRTYAKGLRKAVWSMVHRRPRTLLNLRSAQDSYYLVSRREAGVQTISISRIRGSEGRCEDFDIDFYPRTARTEYRWRSVATAWYRGVILPPISVIQVGELYFVQDGHHRVSVARALGQTEIEARVTAWQVAEPGAEAQTT